MAIASLSRQEVAVTIEGYADRGVAHGSLDGLGVGALSDGERHARVQVMEPAHQTGGAQCRLEVVLTEARGDQRVAGTVRKNERVEPRGGEALDVLGQDPSRLR